MIAFFEIEEWEEQLVRSVFTSEQVLFFRESMTPEHLPALQECTMLVVFIYSKVTREVTEKLPKLQLVCTMSTGYDHIDLVACKERSIAVCNVPTYGDHTVAEHTFCLLLALTRKIVPSVEQVRAGNFAPTVALRGIDINQKTLGVIGTGKIGSNVIRIAKGFSMHVIAFDPHPNEHLAQELGFTYVSLDELFTTADILTVHVPLLPQTKHLVNREAVAKMKQGVIILNTARGGIIDTQALYEGLLSKKIGAVGLDVIEEETAIKEEKQLLSPQFQADYKTLIMDHLLVQHPQVLITPHNAFNSHEALERIIRTTIGNIASFEQGRLQNNIH
jgi:D-lactate dehydrogenase